MKFRWLLRLAKTTGMKWWDDNVLRLSAALSFYTLFSLAPLLTIAVAIAGLVVDENVVQDEMLGQFKDLIGAPGADAIANMLESASQPVQGTIATVVSLVTLIIVSMGMFSELQDALNLMWRITPKKNAALWGAIKSRVLALHARDRHRRSSSGLTHPECRSGGLEQIHSSGAARASGDPDIRGRGCLLAGDHVALRPDVQGTPGRVYRLDGCLARCGGKRHALYDREVGHRPLSRLNGDGLNVRGRLLLHDHFGVGVLFRLDFLLGRRIDLRVCS